MNTLTCIILLLPKIITANNLEKTINYLHCTTHDCVKDNLEFELKIWNNMNPNVDPCDNFYDFACGNFDNITDDFVQNKKNTMFNEILELITVMNGPIDIKPVLAKCRNNAECRNNLHSFRPFNIFNDFMASCSNVNDNNDPFIPGVKENKLDSIFEIISKLGDWPVLKGRSWNETNFNWSDFITKSKKIFLPLDHFIAFNSDLEGNLELNTLKIFTSIGISFINFKNSTMIKNYYYYMVNVAKIFGADEIQAQSELIESLEFEKKLTNLIIENNSSDHRDMTVKEITEKWPTVNWLELFNESIIPRTYFTNQSIVTIKNLNYLINLLQLLEETPKRVQANYAIWKTVEYWAPFVPSINLSKLGLTYKKMNDPNYIYQEHNCFNNIQMQLPELMYAIYLRHKPIDQKIRSAVRQIALDLKNTLLEIFNKTKWLDAKTRDILIKGINSLRIIVGYPDELINDKKLTEHYRELIITQDDFIGNLIRISNFSVNKLWHHRTTPEQSVDLISILRMYSPLSNSAFYSVNFHALGPLLMEKIIFNPNRPHYVNYGMMGFILSHEISHAIYNIHRMFTNNRTIENGWSFTSNQKYNTTKTCLIDQYESYLIEGTNKTLNGTLLFLENSADNIGISLAYLTYQNWKKIHAAEITFPTLPYNSNQLFWLSVANMWCASKSFSRDFYPNINDTHAPYDKRINGAAINSLEFSRDFNCPLGSKMNPINKCILF